MNDNERVALVDELAEAMGLVFGPGDVPPGPDEVAACLPIIDRLIADEYQKGYSQRFDDEKRFATRAVPTVDDDDAVERAAKAMWNSDSRRSMSATWDEVADGDPDYELKDSYRSQAIAALAAAGTAPGLDDDAVEAAAKAFHNSYSTPWWNESHAWDGVQPETYRQEVRDRMRIVLEAAAGTAPGLDELLAPFGYMQMGYDDEAGQFWANLWVKDDPIIEYDGTGPTRVDAIRNAVAQATTNSKGAEW